jgi:hypothetical protein
MLSPYQEEGRRQALAVEGCGFVLVVGDDPTAAAEVALGMGRVQAQRRRVVIADAVGLLAPIDDLVPFDSPLGIMDVFIKGAPIDQVVHQVDPAGNLFVMPSGAMKLNRAELLMSERWTNITEEFRVAEALLLVVAAEGESALDGVLPLVDGVVLVGRAQPLVGARVLAYVRGGAVAPATRPSQAIAVDESAVPDMPAIKPAARPGAIARVTAAQPASRQRARTRAWVMALLAVSLVGEGTYWWWRERKAGAHVVEETPPADSTATGDSAAPAAAAATASDTSVHAAAWCVDIGHATSITGANARITQDLIKELPAVTFAPMDDSTGNRTVRMLAGAFADSAHADSLLTALSARKMISSGGGKVVRLPYALLLQSGLTRDNASFYLSALRTKGLPVYPLVQEDGTVRLYAGAFANPSDAQVLVNTARSLGETPGVTYRTGSTF